MRSVAPLALLAALVLGIAACRPAADRSRGVPSAEAEIPEGFTVVDRGALRVIGDEEPDRIATRADDLERACALLREDFFGRDPEPMPSVWLFRDTASYEAGAARVLGHPPDTRHGLYSVGDQAVLADVSVGAGAPVHYLVHAYVHATVDGCPVWYDEGLGTLFESWEEREGHIVGLHDDRLGVVQRAITAGSLPTIEALTELDAATFHGEHKAVHQATARYLCFHLQQEDRLRTYHQRWLRAQGRDPSGARTLLAVHGEDDLAQLQQRWERWVMLIAEGEETDEKR